MGGRGRGGVRSFMSCSIMRVRSTGWVRCVNIWRTEGHCGPLVVGGGKTPHSNFFFFFSKETGGLFKIYYLDRLSFSFLLCFFSSACILKERRPAVLRLFPLPREGVNKILQIMKDSGNSGIFPNASFGGKKKPFCPQCFCIFTTFLL